METEPGTVRERLSAFVLGKKPEDIHVLLVDDERVSRLVVGNLLRKCNYQVTVATSGLQALEILKGHAKETFHLILTDVMMPDVDGIELLDHIRSDEAFNSMPVVMMSANEHTETVFECIRRGAEDYLLKPVTRKEVQYICQHVWRRQKPVPSQIPFVDSGLGQTTQIEAEEAQPSFQEGDFQALFAQMANPNVLLRQPREAQNPRTLQLEGPQHAPPAQLEPPDRQFQTRTPSHSPMQVDSVAEAPPAQPTDRLADEGASSSQDNQEGFLSKCQALRGIQMSAPARRVKIPISVYFEKRGMTVSSSDSFQIFSAAVTLVQAHHARGAVVKVRPSRLCVTNSGKLVMCESGGRQLEYEDKLYASSEELLGKPLSMASDLYSLGVLFFELFHPVATGKERFHVLSGLRHRQLPLSLLSERPQEAEFVLSLLHPDPAFRPSAAKLGQPDCLQALQTSINNSPEAVEDSEALDFSALQDFLQRMQTNKSSEAVNIQNQICMLDDDIQQVNSKLRALSAKDKQRLSADHSSGSSSPCKRGRACDSPDCKPSAAGKCRKSFDEAIVAGEDLGVKAKWKRIWDEHPALDNLYLKRREGREALLRIGAAPHEGSCEEAGQDQAHRIPDRLMTFSSDLCMLARSERFEVKAMLKYGDLMGEGDMVCAAAFDRDDEYFATAGVSKHIKIFETASVLDQDALHRFPVLEIGVNSKISNLCWNSYVKMGMLAADYDGAISLWDVSTNSVTAQFEEHLKRVWSVDFSQSDPTRFVSGSDDGTVKLWSMRDSGSVATVDSKANVCSVQLSPMNSNLLAFGSANHRAYLYDLRKMTSPLSVINGHDKAISYVRFLGTERLVTASTDNTLKLWNINDAASGSQQHCGLVNAFSGHRNTRNFVGLSVNASGYIACGSETNEVYTYYHSLPSPLAKHSFATRSRLVEPKAEGRQFVSTVCWSRKKPHLLAANSAGIIKILELKS